MDIQWAAGKGLGETKNGGGGLTSRLHYGKVGRHHVRQPPLNVPTTPLRAHHRPQVPGVGPLQGPGLQSQPCSPSMKAWGSCTWPCVLLGVLYGPRARGFLAPRSRSQVWSTWFLFLPKPPW